VYSFGVVILEAITGRDPVDYGRPQNEVNYLLTVLLTACCFRHLIFFPVATSTDQVELTDQVP
jgi:hypothetical protein